MQTRMSSKGQVVIPAVVRRNLGIGREADFDVSVEGHSVVLTLRSVAKPDWRDLYGMVAGGADVGEILEGGRAAERATEDQREEAWRR